MTIDENVLNTLKSIVKLLDDSQIFYVLGGRTGLFVQGVDVELDNEIDICTNEESVAKISQLLGGISFEPFESENFKANIAKTSWQGVSVEFMANPYKKFIDERWVGLPKENIHQIEFDGYKINVFTLESEYGYYKDVAIKKPHRQGTVDAIAYVLNKTTQYPYRHGVYGLILNNKNQILLVFKKNSKMWDFPGGGVDENESLEQAIKREILEELGIANITILNVSKITNKYDWPEKEKEKHFNKTGIWRRGQEQHFVTLKFLGNDSEIKLQEEELLDFKWVDQKNLRDNMSYQDQYDTVARILGDLN